MKTVLNFLFDYRALVVIAVVIILFAVLKWKQFKKVAIHLMIDAEKNAKAYLLNAGKDKEDYVVRQLIIWLPKPVSLFVPEFVMHQIVHYLFVKAKDIIDNGALDGSYKDQE